MTVKSLMGGRGFEVAYREYEMPVPGYNEVLVKICACGVCGSDLHLLARQTELVSLGHEIAGRVIETGRAVTAVKAGDDVVIEDKTFCGRCPACKNGHIELCTDMYDLKGQSGMGEYICVHENMLHKFKGITYEEAAFTEPLAVCINFYLKAKVPVHGRVIIFGTGPLAIMCAELAVHFGASYVACIGSREGTNRNRTRERAALAAGANDVFYTSQEHYHSDLKKKTGGAVDAILVTSPPHTMKDALALADYGARIVTIGLDMGDNAKIMVDIDQLIFKNISIIPFFAEPAQKFPLSLEFICDKVVHVKELITQRIPFEEAAELKELFQKDNEVIKVLLKIQ